MSKSKPTFDEVENIEGSSVMITLCKKPRISYAFPAEIVKDLKRICKGKTLRFVGVRKMNLTEERKDELRERMKELGSRNRKANEEKKVSFEQKPVVERGEGYRAKMKRLRLEVESSMEAQE